MTSYNRDDAIKMMDGRLEIKRLKRETSERMAQKEKEEKIAKEAEFKNLLKSRPEVVRHAEAIFEWAENIFKDEELMIRLNGFYHFYTIHIIDNIYTVELSIELKSLFLTMRSKYGPANKKKLSTPEEMVRELDKFFISSLYNRVISGEAWNSICRKIENY